MSSASRVVQARKILGIHGLRCMRNRSGNNINIETATGLFIGPLPGVNAGVEVVAYDPSRRKRTQKIRAAAAVLQAERWTVSFYEWPGRYDDGKPETYIQARPSAAALIQSD